MEHSGIKQNIDGYLAEARSLLGLAMPLIFGQLAVMGMAVTDAVIAGHASTADLAGISLASSVWSPMLIMLITLVVAVNPILARHYGAGRLDEMGRDARQGLWLAAAAGLTVAYIASRITPLLSGLDADPAVIDVAQGYLRSILWGAPALGVSVALRAVCETSGYTSITMQVHTAALLLNAALDYLFVFGMPGLEAMGGAGCGLASAFVYWFIMGSVLIHLLISPRYHALHLFRGRLRPQASRLAMLLRLGLPMSMGSLAEAGIFSISGILIAGFGAVALAAHQVAMSFASLMFMMPLGLSMALTIRVAQGLGAGSARAAHRTAVIGIGIATAIAACTAGIILVFASRIAVLYTPDPAVIELAAVLLLFAAAFQFADGLQIICTGLLRAYRDTFVPMLLMVLAFWGIGLGTATTLGYERVDLGLGGVAGFWVGLVVALTAAYLLLMTRFRFVSQRETRARAQGDTASGQLEQPGM